MAVLTNKVLANSGSPHGNHTFGPLLSVGDGEFRLDASVRKVPIWLGHFSSAMCGIVQFVESLNGQWTNEIERIKLAHQSLLSRSKNRFCGQTDLCLNEMSKESASPAELIYQYIALSMLDQYESTHVEIAAKIETEVQLLTDTYDELLSSHFVDAANFRFGFEFKQLQDCESFGVALQQVGIEIGAETTTGIDSKIHQNECRFSLNLAFRGYYNPLFWQRLRLAFENFNNESFSPEPVPLEGISDQSRLLRFHQAFQFAKCFGKSPDDYDPIEELRAELSDRFGELRVDLVNRENYPQFREQILSMQIEVYEPARRTPAEEFDMLFESDNPLAIVVSNDQRIAAMVFAGRLSLFRELHGGIDTDPFVDDPTVYYSMDLTVASEYRGGVGRLMKQALVLLAVESGVSAIHGRNRDRLAAGMWAINLSLGSYELQHLVDDYQDDEEFRDCIYYRCPLRWSHSLSQEQLSQLPVRKLIEGGDLNQPIVH